MASKRFDQHVLRQSGEGRTAERGRNREVLSLAECDGDGRVSETHIHESHVTRVATEDKAGDEIPKNLSNATSSLPLTTTTVRCYHQNTTPQRSTTFHPSPTVAQVFPPSLPSSPVDLLLLPFITNHHLLTTTCLQPNPQISQGKSSQR